MKGVQFTLSVPYECSFVKESSVNDLSSYSIPPLTTIRGMIYNGMARPSLLRQDYYTTRTMSKEAVEEEYEFRKNFEKSTHIGIEVLDDGTMKSDLRNRFKHGGRSGDIGNSDGENISLTYVTQHETIIHPSYQITILSEEDTYIHDVVEVLKNPRRVLYLGNSDNMVEVRDIGTSNFTEIEDERSFENLVVPNSKGDNMEMLPIEMESFDGRGTADRGESCLVSYSKAKYNQYYKPDDEDLNVTVAID
jgi:CRISPR-associated Cas5-like protein